MVYKVLKPFAHGHHRYKPGDHLDLTGYPSDAELKRLTELGYIAKDEPKAAQAAPAPQPRA
jgi:hypothetical protein